MPSFGSWWGGVQERKRAPKNGPAQKRKKDKSYER